MGVQEVEEVPRMSTRLQIKAGHTFCPLIDSGFSLITLAVLCLE